MHPLKLCPICGSKKIKRVKRTLVRGYHGARYQVPDVEFDECGKCGERFFDITASRKIDEHSPAFNSRNRRRSA
jgi:YgiT-type zinc finger domain-containing protein